MNDFSYIPEIGDVVKDARGRMGMVSRGDEGYKTILVRTRYERKDPQAELHEEVWSLAEVRLMHKWND